MCVRVRACVCVLLDTGASGRIRPLGTTDTDGLELPYRCWEPNLGRPQEQPLLLTAESSLKPLKLTINIWNYKYMPVLRDSNSSCSCFRDMCACLYLEEVILALISLPQCFHSSVTLKTPDTFTTVAKTLPHEWKKEPGYFLGES